MAAAARGFFPLIASHFAPAKLELAIQIFYALLPVVLITGIATNCTAVLNTFDRFALPALAPIVISVAIILGALLLGDRLGIWAMVYATLAGSLVHAVIVAWMMDAHGYRFQLRWYGMTEAAREVVRQYGPVLLSSVVASGGLLVDQAMAAMLPAGSVSALVYANRFVSVVLTLLAGAVSTAVVPYFSRMIAHRDWAGCRHTMRTWAWLTVLVSAPIAVVLICGRASVDSRYAAARGLWSRGYGGGDQGAGHVRDSDSVCGVRAGVLPVYCGDAADGSDFLLRRDQPCAGCGSEFDSDAAVRRGGHCAGHFAVDGEHVFVSLVLERAAAFQGFGR